jgi:hypothetical protein
MSPRKREVVIGGSLGDLYAGGILMSAAETSIGAAPQNAIFILLEPSTNIF